jgi:hypothetical protein
MMAARYQILIAFPIIVTLFTAQVWLRPALAHGPVSSSKIAVNNEKFGPYILLVATSPSPATVGPMDIWVRVAQEETSQLLRDAVVTVEATPQSGSPALTAPATHEHAGNAFDYVAHLDLPEPGQWDFTIYVEHELGPVNVAFTETVAGGLNMGLLIALIVPFMALALIIGVYLWRQSAAASKVA